MLHPLVHAAAAAILTLSPASAQAKTRPPRPALPWQWELPAGAFRERGQAGYLEAGLGLRAREATAKSKLDRRMFLDSYLTHLPLVGVFEETLRKESELLELYGKRRSRVPFPKEARAVDAVQSILEAAAKRRIVMFNEEHRSSQQRAFMCRLLRGLRELGFTHLACEAVIHAQTGPINERGYPTLAAGLYARDPVYGDMIRIAKELGFTVVGYDAGATRKPGGNPVDAMNSREEGQARNILARTLAKNPKAKVIVYGGRHHISKLEGASGWKPMGSVLKRLAEVDPLSVDLMEMVERANRNLEPAAYARADQEGWLSGKPVVMVDAEGKRVWGSLVGAVDMLVLHPRTRIVRGRPHWLRMGGLRKAVQVKVDPALLTEPMLLQALLEAESVDAVPMDQVVLWPKQAVPALILRPGKYRVRMIDRTGKERFRRALDVDE